MEADGGLGLGVGAVFPPLSRTTRCTLGFDLPLVEGVCLGDNRPPSAPVRDARGQTNA
jgi:hypothetical protein